MDTVCDFEIFQNRIEPVKSMDFDDHYWWNATITDPNLHLQSSSLRLPRSTTIDTASLSFGNVVRGNQNFWQRGFLENEHCPCPPSIVYIYIYLFIYIYIYCMGVYGILTYIGAMKRMDHTHTHTPEIFWANCSRRQTWNNNSVFGEKSWNLQWHCGELSHEMVGLSHVILWISVVKQY